MIQYQEVSIRFFASVRKRVLLVSSEVKSSWDFVLSYRNLESFQCELLNNFVLVELSKIKKVVYNLG